MEKQVDNKFVWVIENPSSLTCVNCYSNQFSIAGCQWQLIAVPMEKNLEFLYLYMGAVDSHSLPSRWRKHVKLRLKIVNRLSDKLSIVTDSELYFDEKSPSRRYPTVLPPSKILAKNGGFLENRELMIVVEAIAYEVVGSLGELEDSKLLSRIEESRDAKSKKETVDVNGFQVLPSQVETVKRVFESYPDFASNFRFKSRHVKSTYMNVLLGLIEMLCQLPEELTDDDLDEASVTVSYVAKGGFKVDWLEKKLDEVKAKKKKVDTGKARLQQMEEELQKLNQKCIDLKSYVSAANVPLSFSDLV